MDSFGQQTRPSQGKKIVCDENRSKIWLITLIWGIGLIFETFQFPPLLHFQKGEKPFIPYKNH